MYKSSDAVHHAISMRLACDWHCAQEYTAGIISLLTHSCMSVAFNIVVHPQLTYQSPYHLGLHATLTARTPAIPSQIEIFSKHSVTCRQTADAVSSQSH